LLTVTALDARIRKNVDGVIRAMAIVGERLDLEYVVIGDGPARNHLESLAASLDLSNRVRFMGRVSAEDLRAAYESSSLFVLVPRPEADDVEGFGLVYLEAAAAGTPALGSRFGGAVDAIQDGVTGFFAEDASPDAIASSLNRFFTGQIRFDAQVVRQHACEHAWPRVLGQVEREYGQLSRRVAAWLAAHPDEDNPAAQAK
jgi:phosphatidylinositol alpha-1,6-mannosyltransferase